MSTVESVLSLGFTVSLLGNLLSIYLLLTRPGVGLRITDDDNCDCGEGGQP